MRWITVPIMLLMGVAVFFTCLILSWYILLKGLELIFEVLGSLL